jgi:CheY-like chemotaxis protein
VRTVNAQKDTAPFILVAEDSADDRLLLQYAFRSARLPNRYHIVNNGAEAITWLTNAMEQPNNPTFPAPGLLVLDIQMPYKTGLQVLEWVRCQPDFRALPVIVMSGLQSPDMVERALSMGARSYLFKPGDYSELTRFICDFNLLQAVV